MRSVFVSSGGGGGESGGIDGKTAIQRWYKEIEKYDFDANTFSLKTAQLSQLGKRFEYVGGKIVVKFLQNLEKMYQELLCQMNFLSV